MSDMKVTTLQVDKDTAENLKSLELTTAEWVKLKYSNDKIVFLMNFYKKSWK